MAAEWQEDVALAAAAAIEAGRAIMRYYGRDVQVREKAPDQPLTESDLEADRILREWLLGARPEYGWLSEETADDAKRLHRERVWIVDPLDGTRSFLARRPEFGISVGLAEDGAAVLGVILNPATGELYGAWRGGGAWKLENAMAGAGANRTAGKDASGLARAPDLSLPSTALTDWVPLHTREQAQNPPVILASRTEIHDGEFEPFSGWELLPLGSTAYKLARLAEGAADVFLSRGPKSEWDVCAGGLLVQEAGGVATDLRGESLEYNRRDPRVYGILAAPAALHADMLRRVRQMPPPDRLARPAADPLHPGLEEEVEEE